MGVSVRGHERAVEALGKKGALGEISEEPPYQKEFQMRLKRGY
jgi:hypothetical protein